MTPYSTSAFSAATIAPDPVKESKNSLICCSKASPATYGQFWMNLLMWSNEFSGCDSAHSCTCSEFFDRYIDFERHVFDRDDKKVCRVILSATEEAIDEISAKIVADCHILNLELTHEDGRVCMIEIEPKFTDQLCFSWPSLSFDLTRFTRIHKLVRASMQHFMIFLEDEKEQ